MALAHHSSMKLERPPTPTRPLDVEFPIIKAERNNSFATSMPEIGFQSCWSALPAHCLPTGSDPFLQIFEKSLKHHATNKKPPSRKHPHGQSSNRTGTRPDCTKTNYECTICNIFFCTKSELRKHSKSSHFYCYSCGKSFPTSDTLIVHCKNTHLRDPLFCEVCGKIFCHPQQLKEHFKSFHFRCSICRGTIPSRALLVDHWRRAHGREVHVCTFCNKEYLSFEDFKNHTTFSRRCDAWKAVKLEN